MTYLLGEKLVVTHLLVKGGGPRACGRARRVARVACRRAARAEVRAGRGLACARPRAPGARCAGEGAVVRRCPTCGHHARATLAPASRPSLRRGRPRPPSPRRTRTERPHRAPVLRPTGAPTATATAAAPSAAGSPPAPAPRSPRPARPRPPSSPPRARSAAASTARRRPASPARVRAVRQRHRAARRRPREADALDRARDPAHHERADQAVLHSRQAPLRRREVPVRRLGRARSRPPGDDRRERQRVHRPVSPPRRVDDLAALPRVADRVQRRDAAPCARRARRRAARRVRGRAVARPAWLRDCGGAGILGVPRAYPIRRGARALRGHRFGPGDGARRRLLCGRMGQRLIGVDVGGTKVSGRRPRGRAAVGPRHHADRPARAPTRWWSS